ncbi:MAG: L-fucose/L-arabinose isomerase family protein [Anaerolineae bacterium]
MTTLGFVAIARPTFDVPLAQEKTAQVRQHLAADGFLLHGPETLIMDAAGVQAAIELLQDAALDALVVLQASFADSTMVHQMAEAVDAPLLLWALPEPRVGGRLRLNSFCGINLAGHALKRAGISYDYLYDEPESAAALAKVRAFARAGAVKARLQSARIGRIGENPAGFETCLFDAENLKQRLGVEVVQVALENVFAGARAANAEKVAAVDAQLRTQISGMDKVNAEETRGTLSTFVTLQEMAQTQQLNGMAVRCWPEFFTDLGCSACGAMSMMSNSMTPCSCEADVNGTITQLILQWISDAPAFGSDLVSFDVEDDTAVLWHCGLAPLSMADPDSVPEAALHSNRQKPLLMQFPLKPGRVTLARLSEATGALRLVIAGGEMLRRPGAFTGTSGTIRFDSGAQQVMDTLLREGLEHHLSLTYGDHQETLLSLATMLDLPVLRL